MSRVINLDELLRSKQKRMNIPGLGTITLKYSTAGDLEAAEELSRQATEENRRDAFVNCILTSMMVDPPFSIEQIEALPETTLSALLEVAADAMGIRKEFDEVASDTVGRERLYQAYHKHTANFLASLRQADADQMRAFRESITAITAPFREIQEMMRSQSAVFEELSLGVASLGASKFSMPQFAQTTLAWNVASIGLANQMNDIGLLAQRERLSARLFEAPKAYTAFVRHTMERLAADPAPNIAARLRASLNLAEHQLLDITDAVRGFIVVPDDGEKPDEIRVLNAPFTQQDELLAYDAVEDETDTEAMAIVLPTAQTAQRGHRVLELVTQCNEAGKTSAYAVEIFKPTTRLMVVFNDLPWLSPTDRFGFSDVVDCLYFIFYEGAGKDNLRFLDKNGGPLTDTDCDLIWCIKNIRNKWSRHDADHGEERDVQKSWAELAAKFRWLGLAEYPTSARHFQKLHYQLLLKAEDFLARLLSKLNLKNEE